MRGPGPTSRTLFRVWMGLVGLTALTVVISRLHIPRWSVVAALAIAATKSSLVLGVFMRLREEDRAFRIMLGVALFTMATILALTYTDVGFR